MYICIAGGGKVALFLAQTLLKEGHEVAVIERTQDSVEELTEELIGRVMVVHGDCCDADVMRDAGAAEADIFVATTGRDDDNLVACEIALAVFKVPRVLARVNNPKNEKIFRTVGIEGISSTTAISHMIRKEAVSDGDMRLVMNMRQGNLVMLEIELPSDGALADDEGMRVADLDLPPSTVLVAVARDEELDTVNGDTLLYAGDMVVLCVKSEYEDAARDTLLSL